MITEKRTLAEGLLVRYPLRRNEVLQGVAASHGLICVASENEILPGRDALAHLGFYVEPTSAIIWSALAQTIQDLPDPVVVVLTGSGYKYE
jgi:threonine synthase